MIKVDETLFLHWLPSRLWLYQFVYKFHLWQHAKAGTGEVDWAISQWLEHLPSMHEVPVQFPACEEKNRPWNKWAQLYTHMQNKDIHAIVFKMKSIEWYYSQPYTHLSFIFLELNYHVIAHHAMLHVMIKTNFHLYIS